MNSDDLELAHKHTVGHRSELMASDLCGCFYCKSRFIAGDIKKWIYEEDSKQTSALCPNCGIDSVVGSASGYETTDGFLIAMRYHWFDRDAD